MKNIHIYNERMRKSLLDKSFFMDKVESTMFVDFGCADGSLIYFLNSLFPEYAYIGIDNNSEMIKLAKEKNVFSGNINFIENFDFAIEKIKFTKEKYPNIKFTLILSSVLHEIKDKKEFIDSLPLELFDYIVIRDMFFDDYNNLRFTTDQIINAEKLIPEYITENEPGYLYWKPTFVQAMFKSYYMENIETEIKEDYFSLNDFELDYLKSQGNYEEIYRNTYLLPYWKETILKDFGLDLTGCTTHIQLILKKR